MRFYDEAYLKAWSTRREYPKIHAHIFELFSQTFEAESVLDICCSTGLIGQHIVDAYGIPVCGIEAEQKWIDRAKKWGISIPILNILVNAGTMDTVVGWIQKNEATGMMARRCISELFGNIAITKMDNKVNWQFAKLFSASIRDAGIKEIWLEGRANQGRSVHPIPDTDTEIKCLETAYKVAERHRNCAYLVAR